MHAIQLKSNATVHQLSMHYRAARLASCKFWLVDQLPPQQHIGFHGHKYQGMQLVFKLNTTRLIVSSINIYCFPHYGIVPKILHCSIRHAKLWRVHLYAHQIFFPKQLPL
jgi:hypothetical protein